MNRRLTARRSMSTALAALAIGAIAACSAEPTSVTSPRAAAVPAPRPAAEQIALEPEHSPKPLGVECGSFFSSIEYATQSFEAFTREASSVLTGEVVEVGAAQWNTADGEPPLQDDLDYNSMIRLVRVQPSEQLKGEPSGGELVVALPGGQIGCHAMWGAAPAELKPGDEFLFFLGGPALVANLPGALPVVAQWPVNAKGQIETPEDGQLSVEQAKELVDATR